MSEKNAYTRLCSYPCEQPDSCVDLIWTETCVYVLLCDDDRKSKYEFRCRLILSLPMSCGLALIVCIEYSAIKARGTRCAIQTY